jgi:2-haloacid dehalogenase
MVAGQISETVDILTELTDAGVACYALSNMEAETFPLRFERFPFLARFTGIVISGVEGMAKPDPQIFELLLDRFRLDARTTLFIDDNAGNLRPAAALGMATLHYASSASLRHFLGRVGLLPGRPGSEGRP